MEESEGITFNSAVWGYHISKSVWNWQQGKNFMKNRKVVKNSETVIHLPHMYGGGGSTWVSFGWVPGTPYWHPFLEKNYRKINTPFYISP